MNGRRRVGRRAVEGEGVVFSSSGHVDRVLYFLETKSRLQFFGWLDCVQ
jgi:hypothetical protein